MKRGKDNKGFSTVEILCVSFIAVVVVVLIVAGIRWYTKQQLMGEDKILVNTAESVADIHSTVGSCVVGNCSGGECEHLTKEGYVGYFDHPTNTIYGEKRAGYNAYKEMTIGDQTYYGDPGTMVIKVVNKDGVLTLSWVKGDNA